MSARPRGPLPPEEDGSLEDQFVAELETLHTRTYRLLRRRSRAARNPLDELRSDSSGLGNHVLSLMDEVQASFRTLRRKLEG